MRKTQIIGLAAFLTVAAWQGTARAAFGPLPAPGDPATSLDFGDFTVYSLPYLDNLAQVTGSPVQGLSFRVASTPGAIKGGTVVGTGASGQDVNENFTNMDDAYATPSGQGSPIYFNTGDSEPLTLGLGPTPAPGFTGDKSLQWNGNFGALSSYLQGGQFVVFFNLNEEKAVDLESADLGDDIAPPTSQGVPLTNLLPGYTRLYSNDLLIWARFTVYDADGIAQGSYVVGGAEPLDANLPAPLNPDGTAKDPGWVVAHGQITVDSVTGAFVGFGPSSLYSGNVKTVNQNLGADEAAFAVFNQQLSNQINDPSKSGWTLGIDVKYTLHNNGYEQIFIQSPDVVQTIPEPSAIVGLVGLGCVWVAGWAWRRRRARA